MDKKEVFRQILIELMNKELLNRFVSIVFDYNLKKQNFIYAQYKGVNNNIILNIFDNNIKNRFNAYVFVEKEEDVMLETKADKDAKITYIYIDTCYKEYKNNKKLNNLTKLAASFKAKNEEELRNIIKNVFPKKIEKIIYTKIKETNQQ